MVMYIHSNQHYDVITALDHSSSLPATVFFLGNTLADSSCQGGEPDFSSSVALEEKSGVKIPATLVKFSSATAVTSAVWYHDIYLSAI